MNKKFSKQNLESLKFSRRKSQGWGDTELKFIPRRTRSTVSRLNDGTDQWDTSELDSKEEHMLVLNDRHFKV